MAPGQQVRAFAFVLVVRPVPGRALLLGGKLGFELLDPRLECGNHIGHRLAAWWPGGQWFVLVQIYSDQGFAIAGVRARQAVALDDGARSLGRDFKALSDLRVSVLLKHPAGHNRAGLTPCWCRCPWLVTRRTRGYAPMVDERLTRSASVWDRSHRA